MKTLCITFFFLTTLFVSSQNEFKINDIQISPLGVYHTHKKNDNYNTGGLHFGIDVGFEFYQQNFRLQFNTGSEFNVSGTGDDRYHSYNLLYELNPKLANWMETNLYSGLGIQQQSFTRFPSTPISNSYLNFCLGTRFVFFHRNRISLGLEAQGEFNYDNTTYIFSTVLRYNFKK